MQRWREGKREGGRVEEGGGTESQLHEMGDKQGERKEEERRGQQEHQYKHRDLEHTGTQDHCNSDSTLQH